MDQECTGIRGHTRHTSPRVGNYVTASLGNSLTHNPQPGEYVTADTKSTEHRGNSSVAQAIWRCITVWVLAMHRGLLRTARFGLPSAIFTSMFDLPVEGKFSVGDLKVGYVIGEKAKPGRIVVLYIPGVALLDRDEVIRELKTIDFGPAIDGTPKPELQERHLGSAGPTSYEAFVYVLEHLRDGLFDIALGAAVLKLLDQWNKFRPQIGNQEDQIVEHHASLTGSDQDYRDAIERRFVDKAKLVLTSLDDVPSGDFTIVGDVALTNAESTLTASGSVVLCASDNSTYRVEIQMENGAALLQITPL